MKAAAFLLSKRSAFACFKIVGIEAVQKEFPEHVNFCLENGHKTLEQVTMQLAEQLDALPIEKPKAKPVTFKFYIGGYFGTSYQVIKKGDKLLCYEYTGMRLPDHEPLRVNIKDNSDWFNLLYYLETRKWNTAYLDNEIEDGTQWSLEYKNINTIKSKGSNMYPPGFRKFLNLLNKVVAETRIKIG